MSLIEKLKASYQATQGETMHEVADMMELSLEELEYVSGGEMAN